MIASLRFNRLTLELGPGRMIRAVDDWEWHCKQRVRWPGQSGSGSPAGWSAGGRYKGLRRAGLRHCKGPWRGRSCDTTGIASAARVFNSGVTFDPCGEWQLVQSSTTGACSHKEWTPLFRMAGVAGFGDRVLNHQLRTGGAVRVVAVGAEYFAFEDRMSREAMKLGTLVLMATEADFRLGELVHHLLFGLWVSWQSVHASPCCLMRAARPVCPRTDASVSWQERHADVLASTGGQSASTWLRKPLRATRLRILLVLDAFAVAALAAGRALSRLSRRASSGKWKAPALASSRRDTWCTSCPPQVTGPFRPWRAESRQDQ